MNRSCSIKGRPIPDARRACPRGTEPFDEGSPPSPELRRYLEWRHARIASTVPKRTPASPPETGPTTRRDIRARLHALKHA
jgi:hypothetical protein